MIAAGNPAKDRVAFASAATTGFTPHNTDRSALSYAVDACVAVLQDAGLGPADVDGLVGSTPPATAVQHALGLPEVTWHANLQIPFGAQVAAAIGAITGGLAETVLAYHAPYRTPLFTASALHDPFRRGPAQAGPTAIGSSPDTLSGAVGYAAWAARYLHVHAISRECFGLIAVNGRTNARDNPAAALREAITMDDYLAARMIREPLCLLDMDVPVDGADAFVITTAERARDLPHPPVLIHAAAMGMVARNAEDQIDGLAHHGQHVVVEALRARSDLWIHDVDVLFPYDGFSVIALAWIENLGYCGPGDAGDFLREHWDAPTGRALIDGRVSINPHGGALSEGGTQGSGHVREAVHQLQGRAGTRQVPGASTALVTPGGFFYNAQGLMLRADPRSEGAT